MKKQATKRPLKKYEDLRSGLSKEARSVSDLVKADLMLDIDLRQFRKEVAQLTQSDVAGKLGVSQAEVSKIERRRDMLISTLKDYCQAVGAELHISAVIQDGSRKVVANLSLDEES